eukprot:m.762541 g.762541  ORF g.762541 m.762541 type:complete len:424 (+) comp59051_c0_seq25:102-1373(+)
MEARASSLRVRLTVASAMGLHKTDLFTAPDPFVRVLLDAAPLGDSEPVKKTLSPSWNYALTLEVNTSQSLKVEVWNMKKAGKKDGSGYLGGAEIPLQFLSKLEVSRNVAGTHALRAENGDDLGAKVFLAFYVLAEPARYEAVPSSLNPLRPTSPRPPGALDRTGSRPTLTPGTPSRSGTLSNPSSPATARKAAGSSEQLAITSLRRGPGSSEQLALASLRKAGSVDQLAPAPVTPNSPSVQRPTLSAAKAISLVQKLDPSTLAQLRHPLPSGSCPFLFSLCHPESACCPQIDFADCPQMGGSSHGHWQSVLRQQRDQTNTVGTANRICRKLRCCCRRCCQGFTSTPSFWTESFADADARHRSQLQNRISSSIAPGSDGLCGRKCSTPCRVHSAHANPVTENIRASFGPIAFRVIRLAGFQKAP